MLIEAPERVIAPLWEARATPRGAQQAGENPSDLP